MDTSTQVISLIIIVMALIMVMIGGVTMRRVRRTGRLMPALRPMPAYHAVNDYVGLSIESNQPLHMGFGGAGIGGTETMLALASAEFFYQTARLAAVGDVTPIVTLSDPSALPLAQDTLRRAYRNRDRLEGFRYTSARWYPEGSRALAYAAALTAMMHDEKVSTSLLAGRFGAELALILESSVRRNKAAVAVSDQLDGQAIAWAFSNHVLIGEEIFNAGAYLGGETGYYAQIITVSSLRWLLILALLALLATRLTQSGG